MNPLVFVDYTLVRRLGLTLFGDTALYSSNASGELVVVKQSSKCKVQSGDSTTCEDPIAEIEVHRALAYCQAETKVKRPWSDIASLFRRLKKQQSKFGETWHPNILPLLDWGESSDSIWILTPYCAAGDLYTCIETATKTQTDGLPLNVTRSYFQQMTQGVAFLHANGFCHVDLSLENMYLTADGVLKLADFGQCSHSQFIDISAKTLPGKRFYRAPEQYEAQKLAREQGCSQSIDGMAADIFSLGIILFILLCGKPPFETASNQDARWKWYLKYGFKQFVTQSGCGGCFDDAAVDFLSRMICLKSTRLQIDEVVAHPFVTGTPGS
jgi:serine/threonine protein kinase